MFRDTVFCSPRCVRAFFVETLGTFDQIDTPLAVEMVEDFREAYRQLVSAFCQVLE
jgi:hypothetical protein